MASGSDTNTVGREGRSISICSWNVNGLDNAFGEPGFEEYVKKHDIVFLSETMLMEGPPDIPGFRRRFQRAIKTDDGRGRGSGGMVVYVKENYFRGFSIEQWENVMWCTFNKEECGFNKDVVICFIYMHSEEPSFILEEKKILIDKINDMHSLELSKPLKAKINSFPENDVYVTGDFNAWVGKLYNEEENTIFMDDTVNRRGRALEAFCRNSNLVIVNGHSPNDKPAKLTTRTHTLDYLITSEDLKENLADFYVDSEVEYSDHRPLVFKIRGEGKADKGKASDRKADEVTTEGITKGLERTHIKSDQ